MGSLLAGFPLPILAALLAVAGVLHLGLLRDLDRPFEWVVALGIGAVGFSGHLGLALLGGMLVWWTTRWIAPGLTAPARP
jgi:hypothetical protein